MTSIVDKEVQISLESEKVIKWRMQWLNAAGYNKRNARLIATAAIDWRFACNLLKNCKDEDLAMRILF